MKHLSFLLLLLAGCLYVSTESTIIELERVTIQGTPRAGGVYTGQFRFSEATLRSINRLATQPYDHVASRELDMTLLSITSVFDAPATGLAKVQIALASSFGSVTLSEHTLTPDEKLGRSLDLPLQNTRWDDFAFIFAGESPHVSVTMSVDSNDFKITTADVTLEFVVNLDAKIVP